ncbi:hypothetical protein BDN72DRAFT_842536 [Pluteus cervinus]|uniref:Uncharacterized protein n=1 Tax=Pluteus cervinus TaxID=181527 RepID=A0ACD3AQR3_9AGAR|nr:hypothetical protein BDN72DRAFT_842536 [Pluteus cervinus]
MEALIGKKEPTKVKVKVQVHRFHAYVRIGLGGRLAPSTYISTTQACSVGPISTSPPLVNMSGQPTITYLDAFGKRMGVTFMVQSSALSAIAVTSLLGYMAYRQLRRLHVNWFKKGQRYLMQVPDAADSSFLVNLMFAEMLQAIGGLLNLRWVIEGKVTEGSLCTAQGMLKQMGNVGIALTPQLIAAHTFLVIVLEWSIPRIVSRIMISLIWVIIGLIISITTATYEAPYYGNTGLWCWISPKHKYAGIAYEYAFMWFSSFVMLVLYIFIALSLRGVIKRRSVLSPALRMSEETKRWRSVANSMLFYPAVYIFCIFPMSVVRWLKFDDVTVIPDGATIFASIVFSSSGVLNVILYLTTRPNLIKSSSTSPSMAEAHLNNDLPSRGASPIVSIRSATSRTRLNAGGHLPITVDQVIFQDGHPSSLEAGTFNSNRRSFPFQDIRAGSPDRYTPSHHRGGSSPASMSQSLQASPLSFSNSPLQRPSTGDTTMSSHNLYNADPPLSPAGPRPLEPNRLMVPTPESSLGYSQGRGKSTQEVFNPYQAPP